MEPHPRDVLRGRGGGPWGHGQRWPWWCWWQKDLVIPGGPASRILRFRTPTRARELQFVLPSTDNWESPSAPRQERALVFLHFQSSARFPKFLTASSLFSFRSSVVFRTNFLVCQFPVTKFRSAGCLHLQSAKSARLGAGAAKPSLRMSPEKY